MLFFAIIFIAYMKTAVCLENIPGKPVPHAEILDEILTRQLGPAYTQNAIFDFILGVSNETTNSRYLNYTDDNLSMKVLDVDNLKKIVQIAKNKFDKELSGPRHRPSRRQSELFISNPYVVNKARQFMLHTIYLAKERINDTFPFRQKYQDDHSYLIAVLYGASTAIMTKMETLITQQKKFTFHTHFIWYLILYEKMLACNIDINNNVERLFLIHDEYTMIRGPKDPALGGKNKGKRTKGATTLPPQIAEALQSHKGGLPQPPRK